MRFPGVIPAVTTPFDAGGAIDVDALGRNARSLLDAGMTGLVGNGTMGEAGSLSADERRTVIETLVDAAGDRATVTAGVSAQTAAAAAVSARAAAFAAIAIVDVIFAVDSVPAILAITSDTFIVFAANAFALLGLRPLFFLVADLVERLYYLKTALAVLLVFIGAKMAAAEFVGKIGPEYSLPAIAAILGTGVVASLIRNRRAILRECDFPESSPPSRPPSTPVEPSTSTRSDATPARSSTPA
jgi:hypothetical protein